MDNLWKFMFKNFVAIDVILFAGDSLIKALVKFRKTYRIIRNPSFQSSLIDDLQRCKDEACLVLR